MSPRHTSHFAQITSVAYPLKRMRVALISAEAVPYSKTGGLGDVAGALPKALKRIGIDSLLITPCYWQTKGEYLWETAVDDLGSLGRASLTTPKRFTARRMARRPF